MIVRRIVTVMLLLIGGAVAVPAQAATGSVTMALYPGGVTGNVNAFPATHVAEHEESLMVAGRVSPASSKLVLQVRSPGGAWRNSTRVTTTTQNYFFELRAPKVGRYEYRTVVTNRTGVVSAAWSLQVVRPSNTLQEVTRLAFNLVSGRGVAVPARPGAALTVQALNSGRWQTLAQIAQGAGGRYQFSVLATTPGAQRFRTVSSAWSVVGSAALPVFVLSVHTPFTVPLDRLDAINDVPRTPPGTTPTQPVGAVRLSTQDQPPGSALYYLSPGLRTFRATLRLVTDPRGPAEDMLVSIRTDRRTYLVRWFSARTVLPLVVDVSGARFLEIREFDHGWTTQASSHLLLEQASLSTRPAAESGIDPHVKFLADLSRTTTTSTCPGTGLVMTTDPAPASLSWGDTCPDGSAVTYALAGKYTRLQATVGKPQIAGDQYPYEYGVLTVTADGREVARITKDGSQKLDLDLTGVQTLRFAVTFEPDATRAYMTIQTPVLTLA